MNLLSFFIIIKIQVINAAASILDPSSICLKPIVNSSCNAVNNHLNFEFVRVTVVTSGSPAITELETLSGAISVFESKCEGNCQRLAYIIFHIIATTPPYVPTGQYALKITEENPNIFNEIVKIFNIYLANQTLGTVTPAVNYTNNCFYLVFPAEYNYIEQMAIIGYTDNAIAADYLQGVPPSTTITTVNLVSKLFIGPQNTFLTSITQSTVSTGITSM